MRVHSDGDDSMRNKPAVKRTATAGFIPPLVNDWALRNLTTDHTMSFQVLVMDTSGRNYSLDDSSLLLHSRWLMQWVASNRLLPGVWVTLGDLGDSGAQPQSTLSSFD